MWFSVVYSLIDNDTRHHCGQNLLRTHSAAPEKVFLSHIFCNKKLIVVTMLNFCSKPGMKFVFIVAA